VNLLLPTYRQAPVGSLDTLAESLGLAPAQLVGLASSAEWMYRAVPQLKKDGTPRETWDAYSQLKHVQALVNNRFLRQVRYPAYLQGGIKDPIQPRDYVRHVATHAGSRLAIALDIQDFFPSVTAATVQDIWTCFFRFPGPVAEVLTSLTTRAGCLPQGARTSSYLANLAFWRFEAGLVSKLAGRGWAYSRLADDVTISRFGAVTRAEEVEACALAIANIQAHGYKIKRAKLGFHRHHNRMELNGLIANVRPTLSKEERALIRAEVHRLSVALEAGEAFEPSSARRTLGRLGKLKRFHPGEAARLRSSLPSDVDQLVNA
jgi:Reverse transcriptase (RNA-dependent DNA polymerase)